MPQIPARRLEVLHVARMRGEAVRLVRPPLFEPDVPWVIFSDVLIALRVPLDERNRLMRALHKHLANYTVRGAIGLELVLAVPAWIAQRLTRGERERRRAAARDEQDLDTGIRMALFRRVADMPMDARTAWLAAALRHDGLATGDPAGGAA